MTAEFASFSNRGEYFSAHYFAERLPDDLRKGIFATWAVRENDDIEQRQTPREALRALRGRYLTESVRTFFAERAAQETASEGHVPYTYGELDWSERLGTWHAELLHALGYEPSPRELTVHRSGRDHTVQVAYAGHGVVAVDCGWAKDNDEALSKEGPGRLLHPVKISGAEGYETGSALASWLFHSRLGDVGGEPPRFVLLLTGGVIILADRETWGEGRYLAANLDGALERNDRRQGGELATIAALFSLDMLRPGDNGEGPAIDALLKASADNAVGVDGDLREGLQRSVELIAGEVLARLGQAGVTPAQIEDPALPFAKELTREALRYLYRILFLLYAEARPELGILPAADDTYEAGYSVARLRELVAREEQLTEGDSALGYHLYESLDLLFRMVNSGHREYGTEEHDDKPGDDEETRALKARQRSEDRGLRFEPLRSALFEPSAIRLIGRSVPDPGTDDDCAATMLDLRLRNATLHEVLRKLTMKKARRGERGGFISYRNLGINQLGAVYEGLMSYNGFIATTKLYEVAKNGNPKDGSWLVPEDRIDRYADSVFVQYDQDDNRKGLRGRKKYDVGSFVYRLSGRERETSASYYTPVSLTKATVQLALEHRLNQEKDESGTVVKTRAAELLTYRICEPALGSGAFLNEAIEQVAAEYIRRRQEELGRSILTADALTELQRVKAYIALHNAYGIDLNATGVELAEVSLWLNTMHPGMRAPWFGLHLRRGNSLIGARRAVYAAADIADKAKAWLKQKETLAPTELPFKWKDSFQPLSDGAVHHFLLPSPGWAPAAAKIEAKSLTPDAAAQLAAWRKGILKPPATKAPRGRLPELQRLQAVARRAEFLWGLVVKRMVVSEKEIARHIDVWGADPADPEFDFMHRPENPVPKEKVFRDLFESKGTPYWRLKTVMDTWCALWFWPLEAAGLLDGTDLAFLEDGQVGAALAGLPQVGEPISGPAPKPLRFTEQTALFAVPNEQGMLVALDDDEPIIEQRVIGRKSAKAPRNPPPQRRSKIPLRDLTDWIDFAEAVLGAYDIPPDSMVPTDPTLDELAEYEQNLPRWMGMDSEFALQGRFPWLRTVESLAEEYGFLHWELDFALIFAKRGGFDLQVGNPPWVRPRWDEPAVLAEYDPWFGLTEKFPAEQKAQRRAAALGLPGGSEYLLHERTANAGLVGFLGSTTTYPLLAGTQPDLYRAFMSRTWANAGSDGTVGLIHPDSHFTGDKETLLRESAYTRLRVHGDFINAGNRFFPPPVGRSSHFGLHVYGSPAEIAFENLSWLFSTDALLKSRIHVGDEPAPGVRFDGVWNARPHRARVIHVDIHMLEEWQHLTGETGQPVEQTRLLTPVSTAEQPAIQALAAYPVKLAQFDPQISRGFDESGAKEDGLIDYNVSEPGDWAEVILKGPQLGVATPLFKQPDDEDDGEVWPLDLVTLPGNTVPATGYRRATDRARFENEQDRWIDHQRLAQLRSSVAAQFWSRTDIATQRMVAESEVDDAEVQQFLTDCSLRRYTEFYRLAWREFIAPDTERSLYAALVPPGPSHVHTVRTAIAGDNRLTSLVAGFWSSLPIDYLLRTTGTRHLDVSRARRVLAPVAAHPLASALLIRTLRLNCLTSAYSSLWEELYTPAWERESWALPWPGLTPLNTAGPVWSWETPLRTERARRSALVEIDALVAVWLGVDADALSAMYKARFPILYDFDHVTWFDVNERRLAGNRYTYGQGQSKEHWTQFVAYEASKGATPVPDGYTSPFYKADRETEMRAAHTVFQARLDSAIARGEWDPVTQEVPGK
jgi:hypothetical protein